MAYAELAFQFAKELSTQLITISSALIGVSVTFIKDLKTDEPRWLRISWGFYIVSIIFGVWHLMALTGALELLSAAGQTFDKHSNSSVGADYYLYCRYALSHCVWLEPWFEEKLMLQIFTFNWVYIHSSVVVVFPRSAAAKSCYKAILPASIFFSGARWTSEERN